MRTDILFWCLVVISLLITAIFLAGPLDMDSLEPVRSAQILVYGSVFTCGVMVAATLRLAVRGGAETVRRSVLWIALLAIGFLAHDSWSTLNAFYDRVRGTLHPSVALSKTEGEAEFRRAWDGHYRVEAEINGVRERLLIDTGASMVLLPYEAAEAFGIDIATLDFSTPITTANGFSTVAPVTIAKIKVGPIEVDDVTAAVAHPGRLNTGLLGLSFLERLEEASFQGNRLVLRK